MALDDVGRDGGAREDVRVVVVDDDDDLVACLKALLELDGYSVRTAHDAADALRVVAEHRPLCVLLDLGLPHVDGLELARRLRATYGAELVLVAVTGWTGERERLAAEDSGVDFVLTKPVDFELLRKLLPRIE